MESQDQLLGEARNVLKRARRHPDAAALVKMKSAIDDSLAAPERSQRSFRWLAAGLAMAVCAAVFIFVRTESSPRIQVVAGQAIRSDRIYALSSGTVLQIGGTRVQATRDSQIELPVLLAEELRFVLFDGEMELEVEPATQQLLVSTPLAEIRGVGTRFAVSADDRRMDVRVSKGDVDVHERASDRVVRVGAGQQHVVERASEVATAEAVRPEEIAVGSGANATGSSAIGANAVGVGSDAEVDGRRPLPQAQPRISPRRRPKPSAADRTPEPSAAKREARQPDPSNPSDRSDPIDPIDPIDASAGARQSRKREARDFDASDPVRNHAPGGAPRAAEPAREKTPPIPRPTVAPSPPPVELLAALVARADRARRAGRTEEAAALYVQIADHPDGAPFAEEALFRKAELSRRLGEPQAALQALAEAERRFGRGELAPERSALSARIHLDRNDARTAAKALSGVPRDRATLEISIVALDVARALEADRPCEALRLLSLVDGREELRARAVELSQRIGSKCEKSP